MRKWIYTIPAAFACAALGVLGYAVALRVNMSEDAFDPNRGLSINLMFVSAFLFFSVAMSARLVSLFDDCTASDGGGDDR
jgi:hypothetical protein